MAGIETREPALIQRSRQCGSAQPVKWSRPPRRLGTVQFSFDWSRSLSALRVRLCLYIIPASDWTRARKVVSGLTARARNDPSCFDSHRPLALTHLDVTPLAISDILAFLDTFPFLENSPVDACKVEGRAQVRGSSSAPLSRCRIEAPIGASAEEMQVRRFKCQLCR